MTAELTGRRWHPLCTSFRARVEPGDVFAVDRAVWKCHAVIDLDLDEQDEAEWLAAGLPDLDGWHRRPYRVAAEFLGGLRPAGWREDQSRGSFDVRARHGHTSWLVYRDGRWPQCSCCGEPMPCRAQYADEQARAALTRFEEMAGVTSSQCWHCKEVITTRQQSVVYAGENLDMPGAHPPRFHFRRTAGCRGAAKLYEKRWLAGDPRRERILTYPECGGTLFVHADGTTECEPPSEIAPWTKTPQLPGCTGHLDADHRSQTICTLTSEPCYKGCDPTTMRWGCNLQWQPPRRPRNQPQELL